jgi:hypothetical protein
VLLCWGEAKVEHSFFWRTQRQELFRGAWRAGAFLSTLTTLHTPMDLADD